MRLLGLEITSRTKAAAGLQAVDVQNMRYVNERSWWSIVREPFAGAWQRNMEERTESVLTYHAVYACVTLIASDVSKCRPRIVEQNEGGIWNEKKTPFTPVIVKPNRFQNRIKFYEQWIVSKLLHGNTYVLKVRDERGLVVEMYILDPCKTKPMVAPDGSIYYQITKDNLSGVEKDTTTIPASEIIHDVMVPLFHPLCGVSPLTACGLAASQGLNIQRNSSKFFANGSQPSGILTAPGTIGDDAFKRIKDYWEANYTGASNAGKVAVLGDGLTYEAMSVNAVDAQLIEQLKWAGETVCSTFHVPAYKVGVGAAPAYNNIEALDQNYYSQCLQKLFECIELCLDEGLGLVNVSAKTYGVEFDIDDLLRMDTATMADTLVKLSGAGLIKLDEGRKKLGYDPMEGGDAAYLQMQNFAVPALAKRDSKPDPFATSTPALPAPSPAPAKADPEKSVVDFAAFRQMLDWEIKKKHAPLKKKIEELTQDEAA